MQDNQAFLTTKKSFDNSKGFFFKLNHFSVIFVFHAKNLFKKCCLKKIFILFLLNFAKYSHVTVIAVVYKCVFMCLTCHWRINFIYLFILENRPSGPMNHITGLSHITCQAEDCKKWIFELYTKFPPSKRSQTHE